jgi:hypothetical protein
MVTTPREEYSQLVMKRSDTDRLGGVSQYISPDMFKRSHGQVDVMSSDLIRSSAGRVYHDGARTLRN